MIALPPTLYDITPPILGYILRSVPERQGDEYAMHRRVQGLCDTP